MTLKTIPLLGGALTVALSASALSKDASKPNILIILADDLGFSDLGCFGGEISTPNIDRLAVQGMRMTRFYSNPMSAPTRCSLMTGLYQTNAGIGNMGLATTTPEYSDHLRHDCATLAETLREGGYATAISGKWHLGSADGQRPAQRGFGRSFSMIGGAGDYYNPTSVRLDDNRWTPSGPYYQTCAFSDRAVEYIDASGARPLLLYVAYNAPHWPLQAPQSEIDKYMGLYMQGWDALRRARFERQKQIGLIPEQTVLAPRDERAPDWSSLSLVQQQKWCYKMAVYAAMVGIVDQGVGKIVAALDRKGALDNTIIMFLSDNGACPYKASSYGPPAADRNDATVAGSSLFYDYPWANVSTTPNYRYKRFTYQGGINVPCIVRYPPLVKGGAFSAVTAHVMDIMPTCLELAKVPALKMLNGKKMQKLNGVSLVGTWRGSDAPVHEYIGWEHHGECALLKGNWKIVYDHADEVRRWELYDLSRDGGVEITDLADKYPDKVRELEADYNRWMRDNHVLSLEQQKKLTKVARDKDNKE
ncbi:arylsulfatase [Bacteroidia bacterium]|nr:arylsulfatase [Bacteroidia bacterium]